MTYDLHLPDRLDDAVALLARYGDAASVIAGGTALVPLLVDGRAAPQHLVALRGLRELRGIAAAPDGSLMLGALVTHREAETSPVVRRHCSALADAFASIATVRVREQATVGGNLVHADPAHDAPPMLAALGAELVVVGPRGERRIGLDDPARRGSLARGEILVRVVVPPLAPSSRAVFMKYLPDSRYGYGTVSVAAVVTRDAAGVCVAARLVIGGCGRTAVRADAAERALIGSTLEVGTLAAAASLAASAIEPLDDYRGSPAYKRAMARVWTDRALRAIA